VTATIFPEANSIAQCLDEQLRLFEGRVADIRNRVMPIYERRIRNATGIETVLKLDLDNFSRLDW
jgi:hypothetical protein